MSNQIRVFRNRLKTIQFAWKTGQSPDSPAIDLSSATCVVRSASLPEKPTVSILNATLGLCELTFPAAITKSAKTGLATVEIALTFTNNPGYSPDPLMLEVNLV